MRSALVCASAVICSARDVASWMSRAASLLAAPAGAAAALDGGACGVCPIACAQLRNLYGSLVLSFTIVFMNTKSCDSDSECSHPCHSRARFTTLSQAPRSPRSHYLLLPLPVLARDTRQSIKVPARKLLLGLFKGNMIQCQPPARGMLRAAVRGRARAAHQGRAAQHVHTRIWSW